MKKNKAVGLTVLLFMVMASLISNTGAIGMSDQSSPSSSFQLCQSSGPSFDFIMPEFVDLVPGIEPVNLTLEIRVGVTDPDGVSMVIGSHKNNSISEWTNVSMSLDASYPDNYVAWPLNYTMSEPSFLVIWDIKFYANDSLNNWNVSSIHQMSVCRQGGTDTTSSTTTTTSISSTTTTTTDTTGINFPLLPLIAFSTSVVILLVVLYVLYQRRLT